MPTRAVFLVPLLLTCVSGCVLLPPDTGRAQTAASLQARSGLQLAEAAPTSGEGFLPNGADPSCLDDDEAALVALWNNAAFQENLVALGLAHADLVQAGLLPNPEILWSFSVHDKPYRYLVDFPLEALWLRPARLRAARAFSEQEAARLAQLGLDLIRDTRQACADLRLAHGRLAVAREGVRLRGEIARFAKARLDAGDISPQEADTARIDALQAEQDVVRISHDIGLAEERLRNLLGLGDARMPLALRDAPPGQAPACDDDAVVEGAMQARPDLEAAGHGVASAEERLRVARLGWVRVLGLADATAGIRTGHELGPGVRATLPILNQGQGAIARAEADLERLRRQRETLRQLIVQEARQALIRCRQAAAELALVEGQVLPLAEAAIRRAETAYRGGNTPYVVVLETARQFLDARLRRHVLHADLRRARADLERSAARRFPAEAPSP